MWECPSLQLREGRLETTAVVRSQNDYLTDKPLCLITTFNLIRILSHLIRSRGLLSPSQTGTTFQTVTFSQTLESVRERNAEEVIGRRGVSGIFRSSTTPASLSRKRDSPRVPFGPRGLRHPLPTPHLPPTPQAPAAQQYAPCRLLGTVWTLRSLCLCNKY